LLLALIIVGTIDTKELKSGLPEFGVFLTKKELRQMLRTIDPDQSGSLEYNEWLKFMQVITRSSPGLNNGAPADNANSACLQAPDDALASDDWKDAMDAVKLRKRVRDALLAPAMKNYYELAAPGSAAPDITCAGGGGGGEQHEEESSLSHACMHASMHPSIHPSIHPLTDMQQIVCMLTLHPTIF
jgi:hypothetical protein